MLPRFFLLSIICFTVNPLWSQLTVNLRLLDATSQEELQGVEVFYYDKSNKRIKVCTSDPMGNCTFETSAYNPGDVLELYSRKDPDYFENLSPHTLTLVSKLNENNATIFLKKDVIYVNVSLRDTDSFQPLAGATIQYFKKNNLPGGIFETDQRGIASLEVSTFQPGDDLRFTIYFPPGSDYTTQEITKTIRADLQKNSFSILLQTEQSILSSKEENQFDLTSAQNTLERAVEIRDGSKQGQVEALEYLLAQDFEFNGTDFNGINLDGVDITKGNFTEARLNAVSLNKAMAKGTVLKESGLRFAKMEEANFENADMRQCYAPLIWGRGAQFEGANLSGSSFFSADLREANFKNADLSGAAFAFADLRGANFDGADLTGAYLTGALLDDASFEGAIISGTEMLSVTANSFNLTASQKQGACRHYVNKAEYVSWNVRITEEIPNTRFADGVEYSVILNTKNYNRNADFKTFVDKSLPVCATEAEGPPMHNAMFVANEAFWFTRAFLSKANRYSVFKDRIVSHMLLLQENVKENRTLKGDGKERENWIEQLKTNTKKITKPTSKPYLNSDLILLILAANEKVDHGKLSWSQGAVHRSAFERRVKDELKVDFKSCSMWEGVFPASSNLAVAWGDLPEEKIDIYKDWVEKRSAYAPDHFIIKNPLSAFAKWRVKLSELSTLISANHWEGKNIVLDRSRQRRIYANLSSKYFLPMVVSVGVPVNFVFPMPMEEYAINLPTQNTNSDISYELKIAIDRIEPMYDKKKRRYQVLFFVHPEEIVFHEKGMEIRRQSFGKPYLDPIQKREEEFKAWDAAVKGNDIKSYLAYLSAYPEGVFSQQAKNRAEANQELYDWEMTKVVGSREAFNAYMRKYRRGTTYYDEAKAIVEANKGKTRWFFESPNIEPTIKDKDGNIYPVLKMPDNKQWLGVNLNVETPGSKCFEDQSYQCERYGRFYTWEAAKEACKTLGKGWRLSNKADWEALVATYGEKKAAFMELTKKEYPGFDLRLGGAIQENGYAHFRYSGYGQYWTSTSEDDANATLYSFKNDYYTFISVLSGLKTEMRSCRCIKE
ncbi:MAG: pentapeptide repeat-containing protein [Saprospiraceae bacterium]|nr:pentapeptide repeat-containing protein [Saprospiraceae bacterium]